MAREKEDEDLYLKIFSKNNARFYLQNGSIDLFLRRKLQTLLLMVFNELSNLLFCLYVHVYVWQEEERKGMEGEIILTRDYLTFALNFARFLCSFSSSAFTTEA